MNSNKIEISKKIYNEIFSEGYTRKFFVLVPPEHQLIQRNYITNSFSIKNSGLRFVAPFNESRIVDMRERFLDYPPFKFMTADNTIVEIDIAISTKLINGDNSKETLHNIKSAMYDNKNIFEYIYFTIQDRLNPLFKSLTYDEIVKLNLSDRNYNELKELYSSLEELEKEYKIKVTKITKEKVIMNEELKRAYEAKELTHKKNLAILDSAAAKVEVAQKEAETIKIKAEAEAFAKMKQNEVKTDLIKKLLDAGISYPEIAEYLKIVEISNNSNAKLTAFVGDNNGTANAIAKVSTIFNQVKNTDSEEPIQKTLTK